MRYFDRHRKRLTKHHYIRGTLKSVSGEQEVKIEDSAGVPFRKIEIKGNTVVEIKNQALEYSSYLSAIESYTTGGVSGTYAIKLPDGWQGKELTYKLEEKTPLSGVDLYLASGSTFLFSDTLPLIENGIVSEQKAKNYTHLIFKGIFDEEIENENGDILSVPTDITRFWQGHSLIVTSDVCPEFPSSVDNLGNGKMKVTMQGINILKFKDYKSSKTDSDGNVLTCECKDGIITVNGKSNIFTTISAPFNYLYKSPVFEAGVYTYTPYYYREEGQRIFPCDWSFWGIGYAYSDSSGLRTKTFDIDFQYGNCMLYISANYEYKDYKFVPAVIKGEYKSLDELPPYEQYFEPITIEVPTSVEIVKEDGTAKTVDLPFTIYDRLIVDGAGKRVIYEKRSGVWEFKGTEAFSVGTFNNDLFAYKIELSRLGFKEPTGNGYSTHFIPKPSTEIGNRGDACFEYSSFGEKNVCFLYDTLGYSYTDMLSAKNDFKAWLASQYEAGTPVTIVVEYKEPEMIDITNTDFGKALLSLSLEQGKNGYLCLKSEPNATSLVCEYYSLENEDKVLLTVSYQNEAGDALMNDKTHNVRRGSKYQIVSPQIDGYEPSEKEVFGIADGDLTIILKYKEVSDVTV